MLISVDGLNLDHPYMNVHISYVVVTVYPKFPIVSMDLMVSIQEGKYKEKPALYILGQAY